MGEGERVDVEPNHTYTTARKLGPLLIVQSCLDLGSNSDPLPSGKSTFVTQTGLKKYLDRASATSGKFYICM
jgi:hypothetical protein